MSASRTLTLATLLERGACHKGVERFKRLFGDSVEVTEELCRKHAQTVDWDWAAECFLSSKALAAYQAMMTPALAAHHAAAVRAWAAHQAAGKAALAAYKAAVVPAQAAYQVATATAWARAYIGDTE